MEASDPPEPTPSDETLGEEWVDAATAAEAATGEREETVRQARAHIAIRLARMSFGATLCLVGLALLVLPGPGFVVLAIGLAVLARDVAWAERTLAVVQKRLPSDASGKLPRSFIVTTVLVTASALSLSAWWTFLR